MGGPNQIRLLRSKCFGPYRTSHLRQNDHIRVKMVHMRLFRSSLIWIGARWNSLKCSIPKCHEVHVRVFITWPTKVTYYKNKIFDLKNSQYEQPDSSKFRCCMIESMVDLIANFQKQNYAFQRLLSL